METIKPYSSKVIKSDEATPSDGDALVTDEE